MNTEELGQKAEAATRGPWAVSGTDDHWKREVRTPDGAAVAWCGSNPMLVAHANAAYIAAAYPDMVLKLLEVVRAADHYTTVAIDGPLKAESAGWQALIAALSALKE